MKQITVLIFLLCTLTLAGQNKITRAQYWFDNKLNEAVITDVADESEIVILENYDISSLHKGLHSFHLRVRDLNGLWSPVVSGFFVIPVDIPACGDQGIKYLEYWFDSDLNTLHKEDAGSTPYVYINNTLDISSLKKGLHTISYRLIGDSGVAGPVVSRFFIIPAELPAVGDQGIKQVEYWFDNDLATRTKEDAGLNNFIHLNTALDVSELKSGLHTISYRFIGESGIAGPVVSRYFVTKTPAMELPDNKIVAYRYIINDVVSEIIDFDTPVAEVNLDNNVDFRLLPAGRYEISLQVLDEKGMWSSAITDSIDKISYPYAVLNANQLETCAGDTIFFTSTIVDADSISWDFDNGNTSFLSNPEQTYTSQGSFEVTATVYHRDKELSNSYSLDNTIAINPLPLINLGEDITITEEESVVLDAGAGYLSYKWNDIPGTQMYTVDGGSLGTGVHPVNVWVENSWGCLNSDTISVTVTVVSSAEMISGTGLKIFPNPVKDHLNIWWETENIEAFFSLLDLNGKMIIGKRKISNKEQINMQAVAPGKYYMMLDMGKKLITIPLVKY